MTEDETKAELCRRLIEGESLRVICRTEGMPATSTVCRWLVADEAFQAEYKIAREMQAETMADQIMDIADTPLAGVKTTLKPDGTTETVTADMIEHRRLQVDARKWMASKLAPKKYGEASLIKHADSDGNRLTTMDDTARAARLAAIFAELSMRSEKALTHD